MQSYINDIMDDISVSVGRETGKQGKPVRRGIHRHHEMLDGGTSARGYETENSATVLHRTCWRLQPEIRVGGTHVGVSSVTPIRPSCITVCRALEDRHRCGNCGRCVEILRQRKLSYCQLFDRLISPWCTPGIAPVKEVDDEDDVSTGTRVSRNDWCTKIY